MAFLAPKQLITNEAETITRQEIPSIIQNQLFTHTQFKDPFQGH